MSGTVVSGLLLAASCLGGALVAAQGPIYARMAAGLGGPIQAAFLAFALATLALALLMAVTGTPVPRAAEAGELPPWIWVGGLIGVYMVLVSILAVPRVGVVAFMVAAVAGQAAASLAYDHIGAFGLPARPVTIWNSVGVAMVVCGVCLTVWK